MKTWSIALLMAFFLAFAGSPLAENHEAKTTKSHDSHGHDEEAESHAHEDHDEHGEEGGHAEHGEEEAPKNVGPNKGITSYDEKKGFVLSAEATKNFRIESLRIDGSGPWSVPPRTLVITGEEKSVYRFRDGFLKRIRIEVQKKTKESISIVTSQLKSGDAVIVSGAGFLRIAEVDLTSGESGHHH